MKIVALAVAVLAASIGASARSASPEQKTPPAEAAAMLAELPPSRLNRLEQRKSVLLPIGNEAGFVRALVIFEQPLSKVMRLLTQTTRQPEFRPDLAGVETIEWAEGGNLDQHNMKIMFIKIRYRIRHSFDYENHHIRWELDGDYENDVQHIEGSWELFELDANRTLGRFRTRVNLGPAMPLWLQDYATRKNVPATVENIRRWVDSDGTYRP